MKAYCITLPSCNERRQMVEHILNKNNINYTFFLGIDARVDEHELLDKYNHKAFLYNMGRPAVKGEIGCYASHYLLWEKCVQLNEPIIIFEDDFSIKSELFQNTLNIAQKYIDTCGYIRLEDEPKKKLSYLVRLFKKQKLIKFLKVPQRATGYAISPSVAALLIKHSNTFDYPVDVFVRNTWIHKQPIFGVCPAGLEAGNIPSIIGKRKRTGKKNWIASIMKIINKLKNMSLNLLTNIYHLRVLGKKYQPIRFER